MKPLVYAVTPSPAEKHVELVQIAGATILNSTWQKLASNIAQEESLTSYPSTVLAKRWQQGYAALALENGEIVSYTSVVPLLFSKTRRQLSQELGFDYTRLPSIDFYEFASGWTHPTWRRKGISLHLRRHLLGQLERSSALIASVSVGLGASYVLEKMGWQIIGWSQLPYLTSLIGIPIAGLKEKIDPKMGWSLPPPVERYEGEHISPSQKPEHPWTHFCHFWISDRPLAQKVNQQLFTLLQSNLRRWREAVLEAMNIPAEFGWKPIFFDS